MSFQNIPLEMREFNQWVNWRLEFRLPMAKPTKVPYHPKGFKASVTKVETWSTFDEVCAAPITCLQPVDPDAPISETGFSGIGFVLTQVDPFLIADLDNTYGDEAQRQEQIKIFNKLNSYAEYSPSGTGCHIIVKAKLPHGRRRAAIELYPHERFMTMTGNVIHNVGIADRQTEAEELFHQLKADVRQYTVVVEETEQSEEDEAVVTAATNAVNGPKFNDLYTGDWQKHYPSQSEADFALIDIIAFYTQNKAQIKRIFRASMLGQRDKAQRDDYLDYMIEKSFDRKLPPINMDGFAQMLAASRAEEAGGATAGEPGGSTAAAPTNGGATLGEAGRVGAPISHGLDTAVNPFPPGLLGEVAQFLLDAAPRPVPEIALAGAVGFLSGLAGRAYNISGTGLNQYILVLAQTGVGKEAIADGVSKLKAAILPTCPTIVDYGGPGEIASAPGLIKWLANKSCVLSIVGEFGQKMRQMAAPNASAHEVGLSRCLLQMYAKSGHSSTFDPMAYSDREKNTVAIRAPSLTLLGESVPDRFYDSLDESLIADGLLPRFMIFEYKGKRAFLNHAAKNHPVPFGLAQKLSDFVAHCSAIQNQQSVLNVEMSYEAATMFNEFDTWTTNMINAHNAEVHRQLWNRAHLKAMKLAAVRAVGENWVHPVVNLEHTMWATNMIVEQTNKLIAKFETGTVGLAGGAEGKQIGEVIRVISQFIHSPFDKYEKYGGTFEMHRDGVITEAHISRRLINLGIFKNDRMGATNALKRSIKTLLDADDLREMPAKQMEERYGTKPRSFVVSNPNRFKPQTD